MGINDAREQLEVCKDEYGKLEQENARLRKWRDELFDLADKHLSERNGALAQVTELQAVIERLRDALPDVLDAAEGDLHRVQGEWGIGPLPDDDKDLQAINAVRALLAESEEPR